MKHLQEEFESKYTKVNFSDAELLAMKTPRAVLNTQKGWKLDREKSEEISNMLKPFFGTEETEGKKISIVAELQEIITNWSLNIAVKEAHIPEKDSKKYQAKLLTFGSSILGVSSRKGDIDMVCTCPKFIERNPHFEEDLFKIFQANPHVRSLINIRTAKVPILTFVYKDQDIDISFAQLQLPQLPPTIEEYVNDELLEGMEEKDIMSLSGRRCNQSIIKSVPNIKNFQIALKFLKLWAQSKGIYENSVGFLGGISWAIMMAKICQMFPNYEANQLLDSFFYYYSSWDFTNIYVLLNEYSSIRTPKQRALTMYMNVMTACFPEYNSTERVKEITLYIIKQRLQQFFFLRYQNNYFVATILTFIRKCIFYEICMFLCSRNIHAKSIIHYVEANDLIQKEVKYQYKHYKDLLVNYDFIGKYSKFIEYGLYFPENGKTSATDKEFEEFMNSSKVKILTLIQRLSESRPKGVEFCPWPQFFTKTQVSFRKIQVMYIGLNEHSEDKSQNLEQECKLQIQSFYQFLKNDIKYSAYLEKFEVGMDWISNKEIVKKTFKITNNNYDILPKSSEKPPKQDISKFQPDNSKRIKPSEQISNNEKELNSNGQGEDKGKEAEKVDKDDGNTQNHEEEEEDLNDFL